MAIRDETKLEKAAQEVIEKELSVRQTEAFAAKLAREPQEKKPEPIVNYVKEAEKELTNILGRAVKFSGSAKKGRISLEFYSPDDREALMQALRSMDKPWKNN